MARINGKNEVVASLSYIAATWQCYPVNGVSGSGGTLKSTNVSLFGIWTPLLEKANCWPLCFNSIVGAEQITISRTSFLPRCQKSGAFPYQGRIWSPRSTRGPRTWRRLPPAGRRPPRGWWRCRCLPAGQLGGRSFRQSGHQSKTRPGMVQGLQPSFWNQEMLGN